MSDKVKKFVDELICNYDSRPQRIRLNRKNYKKKIDFMPTYRQIASFLNNRRKTLGEKNDI